MLRSGRVNMPNGRSWPMLTAGSGPLLVWLHGLRRAEPSDPILIELTRRFRVVAPLAPGFVDPHDLDRLDDIHDVALAYDDFLAALGEPVRLLVGHSLGGMFAAEAAAHVPGKAQALALLAPFGLWSDDCPIADPFAVPAADLDELLWNDRRAFEAYQARTTGVEELDAMLNSARDLRAAAKFLWPIPDKGLRKRLSRIAGPVVLLFGARDRIIPVRYAEEFSRLLPSARTKIVDGAGHMSPFERCEETIALLLEFAG